MKPMISKTPDVPSQLTQEEIDFLTQVTFYEEVSPQKCDVLFIFSGTHPGHWEKAIEAYQKGYVDKILVTGGRSLTGTPHPDWHFEGQTEADVIMAFLLEAGIPKDCIVAEKKSTNTLENVTCAKEVFDFSTVDRVMFSCKSHATGRQWRTLVRNIPNEIEYIPYTFDAAYKETPISRYNWMETEIGRSRVWGEYLRIKYYGEKGDILPLENEAITFPILDKSC